MLRVRTSNSALVAMALKLLNIYFSYLIFSVASSCFIISVLPQPVIFVSLEELTSRL